MTLGGKTGWSIRGLVLAVALCALSCSSTSVTALRVTVGSDLSVGEEVQSIAVQVVDSESTLLGEHTFELTGASAATLPLSFLIEQRNENVESVRVRVSVSTGSRRNLQQVQMFTFLDGEVRDVAMSLSRACAVVPDCGSASAAMTCAQGVCVAVDNEQECPQGTRRCGAHCSACPTEHVQATECDDIACVASTCEQDWSVYDGECFPPPRIDDAWTWTSVNNPGSGTMNAVALALGVDDVPRLALTASDALYAGERGANAWEFESVANEATSSPPVFRVKRGVQDVAEIVVGLGGRGTGVGTYRAVGDGPWIPHSTAWPQTVTTLVTQVAYSTAAARTLAVASGGVLLCGGEASTFRVMVDVNASRLASDMHPLVSRELALISDGSTLSVAEIDFEDCASRRIARTEGNDQNVLDVAWMTLGPGRHVALWSSLQAPARLLAAPFDVNAARWGEDGHSGWGNALEVLRGTVNSFAAAPLAPNDYVTLCALDTGHISLVRVAGGTALPARDLGAHPGQVTLAVDTEGHLHALVLDTTAQTLTYGTTRPAQ